MRSMSEDTLSSRPPSLPIATTMRSFSSQRRGDRELGEVAHRAAHLLEVGEPAKVARHHAQQHALAQAAQAPHERCLVVALGAGERLRHLLAAEARRRCVLGPGRASSGRAARTRSA